MTKPGLFGRLKNAIGATLNSAVDSVSDPGQEIALMIDDLGAQIKKGEANLKQAVVDQKVLERKVGSLEQDEVNWQEKAEAALRLDDEGLARAALERKTEIGGQREAATLSLQDQKQVVVEMKLELEAAKRAAEKRAREVAAEKARLAKQMHESAVTIQKVTRGVQTRHHLATSRARAEAAERARAEAAAAAADAAGGHTAATPPPPPTTTTTITEVDADGNVEADEEIEDLDAE